MDRTSMDMLVRHNVWVLSGRPSGSHRERVLSRISPAQSVYRMIEVTSGKKPVAPEILGTTSVPIRSLTRTCKGSEIHLSAALGKSSTWNLNLAQWELTANGVNKELAMTRVGASMAFSLLAERRPFLGDRRNPPCPVRSRSARSPANQTDEALHCGGC